MNKFDNGQADETQPTIPPVGFEEPKVDTFDFGGAIRLLKEGVRITRRGWNGKGMYLYMVGAGRYPPTTPAGRQVAAGQADGLVPYRPYIAMFTVDRDVVPWVASQSDLLMDDWIILP